MLLSIQQDHSDILIVKLDAYLLSPFALPQSYYSISLFLLKHISDIKIEEKITYQIHDPSFLFLKDLHYMNNMNNIQMNETLYSVSINWREKDLTKYLICIEDF